MRLDCRVLILACIAWCLLALVACGLEPRYALPPPERDDGAFRWIDATAASPPDYLPVMFSDPKTEQRLAVCRSFIVDDPEPDQGYHTGELRLVDDGLQECRIPHRGELLRFQQRENAYQQLWARSDAAYSWEALDDIPERPLTLSSIWQRNRVPSDYVINTTTKETIAAWFPCAAKDAQGWHIGKLNIRDGAPVTCYIELAEREVAAYADIRVLYAPVP